MTELTDPVTTDDDRLLVGRYRVGELVGRGGMSEVHRGVDTRLGRTVAVKLLKSSLAADPAFRTRFRQEAQAAARMAHPTIVRVFDAGEETVRDDRGLEVQLPFIVMEYVEGTLLRDIIAAGPLEVGEASRIAGGILTALEYSHRAGVVHRDIKPGNVMITRSGQVKVMDFGIARAVSDTSATVAQTTTIMGTANYFSPEQAKGESVDARTDLYSAGVVLFEMLTGRTPFRGDTAVSVAYQHVSEAPVAPSSINPKVSPALDLVVERALSKDRFDRYQSASEFRRDLELAASGQVPLPPKEDGFAETIFGPPPAMPTATEAALRQLTDDETVVRTQNRPPVVWIWAGIASIAVIVIALLVWVLTQTPGISAPPDDATVPKLAGLSYQDAVEKLGDKNMLWVRGPDEYSADVAKDHVIRTEPKAGTPISLRADKVTLIVSLGKKAIAIPDVTGQPIANATKMLTDAGFTVGATTKQNSPTVPADTVITTDPKPSAETQAGSTINLIVSNGLVELPDVTGQSVEVATGILTDPARQLTPSLKADSSCPSDNGSTIVRTQSLAPGDVPQGSTVILTYCTGSAPPEPPKD